MSIVLLPYSRKPLRQLTSQLVDPWKFTVGEREKLCHSNPPPPHMPSSFRRAGGDPREAAGSRLEGCF